jgi:hypothetical protein
MKHIILLILITLGVWAQEIGVPYVQAQNFKTDYRNSSLSPDMKIFYKLDRDGKFTVWNLHPFKKINEIYIDDVSEFTKFAISINGDKIFVPQTIRQKSEQDNKNRGVIVVDTEKQRQIALLAHESEIRGVVVSEKNIFTLTDNSILRRWDIKTFQEKQRTDFNETKIIRHTFAAGMGLGNSVRAEPTKLIISGDKTKLIVMFSESILILNSDTLKVVKSIKKNQPSRLNYMDITKNILYYNGMYSLNLDTLEIIQYANTPESENNEWLFHGNNIVNWFRMNQGITPNPKDTLMSKGHVFINPGTEQVYATLYEFVGDEWIIITPNGYFDGSPDTRKYLYMKAPSGESVPIDDATYNKFHKLINLKD